ncbi:hypothetical protein LINGRAHAP2_LOCUS9125, partial [Linum grandiflorum]
HISTLASCFSFAVFSSEIGFTLSHVFREGNFLADCLARRDLSVLFGVHSVPLDNSEIRHWVLYDTL